MSINEEVLEILKNTGAVITDSHIVGTSGRHMSVYINKDSLLSHPTQTSLICSLIAQQNHNLDVDLVVAPAVAGAILGHEVARQLSKVLDKEVLSAYADKAEDGRLVFKRGYDQLVKDKKVLIIEDTLATGFSVNKMIDVVREFGGKILAINVIVNRVPKIVNSETLGFPLLSLCDIEAETYDEKNCPLCRSGVPINMNIGHGKKQP